MVNQGGGARGAGGAIALSNISLREQHSANISQALFCTYTTVNKHYIYACFEELTINTNLLQ